MDGRHRQPEARDLKSTYRRDDFRSSSEETRQKKQLPSTHGEVQNHAGSRVRDAVTCFSHNSVVPIAGLPRRTGRVFVLVYNLSIFSHRYLW